MAPLPTIPLVHRVALEWSNPSQGGTAANVLHFRTATVKPATDVFECLNSHVTAALWQTVVGTGFVDHVDVTPLDGHTARQTFPTNGGAKWTGSGSGDPIPAVASVVKLQTLTRGRSFRGRIFLPWMSEGLQANGKLDVTTAAAATVAWAALMAAVADDATTPMTLVVASYKLSVATELSAIAVEQFCATQRRRQSRLRAA